MLPIAPIPAFIVGILLTSMSANSASGASNEYVIAAGNQHTLALKTDGSLWGWGDGNYVGVGLNYSQILTPRLVGNDFKSIAANSHHSAALKKDGSLWEWGFDFTSFNYVPKKIGTDYVSVAVGENFSLAVKGDGTLWSWGSNAFGQLGDDSSYSQIAPSKVGSGYIAVAAGGHSSMGFKADGSLWAWGHNLAGKLGINNQTDSNILAPALVGYNFTAVAIGSTHTIALKSDGSLWSWGGNTYGQLGDGSNTLRTAPKQIGIGYTEISAGNEYSVALKSDGTLWGWGKNSSGTLGDGTLIDRNMPTQIGTDYVSIATGYDHTIAIKSDGSLWAWGNNAMGQLGDGTTSLRATPKMIIGTGFKTGQVQTILPQSGWWWNASEGGRGFFIEVSNGRFFIASFLYDDLGNPAWYVTGPGSATGNTLAGTLGAYRSGQTLTGSYRLPTGPSSAGNFSVAFSDATHGTITWPGGSVPIVRYPLVTGSLSAAAPSFQPETGWWWNAGEGGRGFSMEIQGDNMFVAGFMYDTNGNPIWYVSGGKMTNPNYYQGTWQQCSNGQSITGTYRLASCTNVQGGTVSINFSSISTATMLLPDGRQMSLSRYSF